MRDGSGLASTPPRRELSGEHPGWFLVGHSVLAAQPLRKVHDDVRHMITVGRVSTNDVILADRTVSRFHAWFREHAAFAS